MYERRGFSEEVRVSGSMVVAKLREVLHEGNVRHVQIRQGERVVLDLPLTVVTVGVLIAPALAVLGGLAAVATDCVIRIERGADKPIVS